MNNMSYKFRYYYHEFLKLINWVLGDRLRKADEIPLVGRGKKTKGKPFKGILYCTVLYFDIEGRYHVGSMGLSFKQQNEAGEIGKKMRKQIEDFNKKINK